MKIHLEQIDASSGSIRFEGSPQWWAGRTDPAREVNYSVKGPFGFEIEAQKLGNELIFEGNLSGEIEVECSRCLVRYRERVSDGFRLVLEPCGDRVPADPESAAALARDGLWLEEDLEAGSYRGSELNLETYLAELIALALPVQPLCRPECEGLCTHCGAELSHGRCGCAGDHAASPFAVLATLLDGKSGGET